MSIIWELDFYSRPILDENQKKIWEVLICESPLDVNQSTEDLFRFSRWCPNQQVNSIWLREALESAIAQAKQTPTKIRFFRRQMNNMITKSCQELEIPAQATRRTYALDRWLQERMQEFYPNQPGYQPSAAASSFVRYQPQNPQLLPDALQGQKWAIVSLEAAAFGEMKEWVIDFGEAFPLSMMGLTPNTRIPGIIIFSDRAKPLAAWMSGLDLAFVRFESGSTARLLLETGASDSWILAPLNDPQTLAEAKGFEAAKENAQQVHFLAVQSDSTSEAFAGFWLLQELK
ncbi:MULTISPECIES: Tab2/Atab2 family RNA-binding protein [unclassified Coleofasciculus]|uniref:Tab2/Atab2 family RNA-binding protein n=1 Tax=unclassified Coleofasciculus TaxID=2692782 RepID=UPI0018807358|nr:MULTISPECIES: Tab2/Atab2 family RNA-binding protein [unclassified Coleofasciculus]MBE9129347.1 Tab2/Atab2 family RNA-binding protein [Coleofasciculus sp. LEGE 07081]MBE9151989.1 Tab2/Atab2 family RNA-binding protein [Coleofasciculus sp. LEGE 07092]